MYRLLAGRIRVNPGNTVILELDQAHLLGTYVIVKALRLNGTSINRFFKSIMHK
jgi:hypothetical protein